MRASPLAVLHTLETLRVKHLSTLPAAQRRTAHLHSDHYAELLASGEGEGEGEGEGGSDGNEAISVDAGTLRLMHVSVLLVPSKSNPTKEETEKEKGSVGVAPLVEVEVLGSNQLPRKLSEQLAAVQVRESESESGREVLIERCVF